MTGDKQEQSSGFAGMAERAQDLAGGMMGMAGAATAGSVDADSFVASAASGGAYEVAAAALAQERGRSETVRTLAKVLRDDHTTAHHQLRSTLRSMPKAPGLSNEMTGRHAQMLDHLRDTPGEEFDDRYLEQQMLAHQETLTLFQGYAGRGDDPRLRLFAQATVPSLERHLEMVRALRKH